MMGEHTDLWNAHRSGWDVGRLFEPTPPSPPVLLQWMSRGLTEIFELFLHYLFKEWAQYRVEFPACTKSYLAASPPPHLWDMSKDNGKNNMGVMWTSELAHLAPDLQFFLINVNTNLRQCRLHLCPNNYFRRTKKCMVNFLATPNRWLNNLEDTHAVLKVCYCVTRDLLPGLVIGGGHQSRTKIRGIIWKVGNVCPDMCFLICLTLVITISPESYLAILSHTVYPLGSSLNKLDFGNKRWTLVWHRNVLLQHVFWILFHNCHSV